MLDKIDVGKIVADLVQSVVQKKVLLAGVCRFRNRDNLRIVNIGPKEFMGAFASFVMIPGSRYDILASDAFRNFPASAYSLSRPSVVQSPVLITISAAYELIFSRRI